MSDILLKRRREGIVELTLNRPSRANALDADLVDALAAALADCSDTRLLVLRGSGRHFCAGFDFSGIERQSDADLVLRFIRIEALLQSIFDAPFPTLALAHGRVYGAGADLVCACEERIAAPGAVFAFPGPRFGVALGTRRLAHRIGVEDALGILLHSRTFDGEEAVGMRFLSGIAAQEEWDGLIEQRHTSLLGISAATTERLVRAVTPDTRSLDMAALVESVRIPGLAERMRAYFDEVTAKASPSK